MGTERGGSALNNGRGSDFDIFANILAGRPRGIKARDNRPYSQRLHTYIHLKYTSSAEP
jgi:hypothetical protein